MKKTLLLSLTVFLSLFIRSSNVLARTPWVQECLDTMESYRPYLHYDHGDCTTEDYPSDLIRLPPYLLKAYRILRLKRADFFFKPCTLNIKKLV